MLAAALSVGWSAHAAETYTPGEPVRETFGGFAEVFLENHCYDCHDAETMNLKITRPALIEAFERMGKNIDDASQSDTGRRSYFIIA